MIPGTSRRLEQTHQLWHEALTGYPDADLFCLRVNSLLTAARSITWILQKELGHQADFRHVVPALARANEGRPSDAMAG